MSNSIQMSRATKLFAAATLAAASGAASATPCGTMQTVSNPGQAPTTVFVPGACPPPTTTPIPSGSSSSPVNNGGNGGNAAAQAAAAAAAAAQAAAIANGGNANAQGGIGNGGAGGNGTGGNAVNNLNYQRNAPSTSPSAVGAGVVDCYDKNGISFVLSTVYDVASFGITYSFDAKEIPGCAAKANKKAGGLTALQSDDGTRFVFGAKALGLETELDYAASPAGQEQAKKFNVSRGNSAPGAAPVTVAIYNQPAAAAEPSVPKCKLLDKKGKVVVGEWVQVGKDLICKDPRDAEFTPR